MMKYIDQLSRELQLNELPKRIVSLVPSQTELLVDLGLEDLIVGVTKFCVHPEHLRKEKTIVGGTKQVNFGKIKALQPDIILCNKEENTREIVDGLIGIAPIHLSDIFNLIDCFELIEMYGNIFKVGDKASKIIADIKRERELFQQKVIKKQKPKVAYFIWKNPWMVTGSETFIDYMLNEAGFENVFKTHSRYPEITLDDPKLQSAELLLLSSEPFPFKEKHASDLQSDFPDKEIIIVDGELFSWYGSRLKISYKYFLTLHKGL